ncbi:MAG: cobyrinate a,c-diamide synthase, partial [Brachymonas sp.]|nr:cobyrinate a,c-diamide synthase [Brachymonas sp.]
MNEAALCPALLVAAPASGQGKTTAVSALARLHARQGRRVQVFKCGPDFLDPGWHQLASGKPVHNLDLWVCGEHEVRQRLYRAARASDLILIEGVMGLFDGQPSAADIAGRFGIAVVTVIDAGKMAETFAAVAHGLQHWRPGLRWAGALANQVGSDGHAQMLERAMGGQGFLGAVRRNAAFALPERHLGLAAATEMDDALQRLDAAADALAQTPLGQMDAAALQQWATRFEAAEAADPVEPLLAGKVVAVARDAAFRFIYQANLDTLQQLGAELCFFSPLADAALPPCDAVWLPGGYPELHAATLAGNAGMCASIHAHAQAGKPLWAECGGMMALFESLQDQQGE